MGRAMDIDYSCLPSGKTMPLLSPNLDPKDKTSIGNWKDGLHFYRELDDWAKKYEEKYMVPDQKNYETAIHTRNVLLMQTPRFTHSVLNQVVSTMMDDRLRTSMLFDKPHPFFPFMMDSMLSVRKFVLRWFTLPRIFVEPLPSKHTHKDKNGVERRYFEKWDTAPHVS
jgi:hypothetical protein